MTVPPVRYEQYSDVGASPNRDNQLAEIESHESTYVICSIERPHLGLEAARLTGGLLIKIDANHHLLERRLHGEALAIGFVHEQTYPHLGLGATSPLDEKNF